MVRGSTISDAFPPSHNAAKYIELLTPWDAHAVLIGESGQWTVALSAKYGTKWASNVTADDLEAISATCGLGELVLTGHQHDVCTAFLAANRVKGMNVWDQLLFFIINTPFFHETAYESIPTWARRMKCRRSVSTPEAAGDQTDSVFFDVVERGCIPLLGALLANPATHAKLYRAASRGWLELLPARVTALEASMRGQERTLARTKKVLSVCKELLEDRPIPEEVEPVCNYCWADAESAACTLLRCARCNLVLYCCKEHQKLDWKSHKDVCNPSAKTKSKVDLEKQIKELSANASVAMRKLYMPDEP
jgi:hypothetical protein